MELVYDLWHLAFANLVQERAPAGVEVTSEVRLTIEPQRADLLLIRRTGARRDDTSARVLRGVWPRLSKVTVVEFKSPTRSSFRRGDLIRLWGYGPLYQAAHIAEVPCQRDLTLLLVIPSLTPTLLEEIGAMGWQLSDLGGGYRRIDGAVYDLLVAVTDEVAKTERDEFLRIFSHEPVTDPEASWWLRHWMMEASVKQDIKDIPGFDEMFEKFLDSVPLEKFLARYTPEQRLAGLAPEQRLAGLAPEQRLAGLAPEQRLAGLAPEQRLAGVPVEQQILLLPDDVLRVLPESYVRTLAPDIQEAIRRRVGGSAPAD
ncbi:hypothetical protein [Sorangium sp. So ce233]|uniref:hypothetical protein n=1 Tax=Sorangium sp. So ce233 TaxID=3133290 RepID=UPI003F63BEF5